MPVFPSSRRIEFTAPGEVRCVSASAALELVQPTEIIIRNRHSLISAGTELACLSGTEWWFQLPGTPGYAAVGDVLACGASVKKVAPGDMVLTHGPHAEYYKIDTTDRYTGTCLKLPAGLDPRNAPMARLASISFAAIRMATIELGDNVLVAGLGLIGNLAAQLASAQGAVVIAVDLSAKRRAIAARCGIAHTIDSGDPGWKATAQHLAGHRGITTFIDATGLATVITAGTSLLHPRGETILLGTPRAPVQGDLTAVLRDIHLPPFATYRGALEWRLPTFADEFSKHSIERNSEILVDLAARGIISFDPLVTQRFAPENAADAYRGLQLQKEDYLGVIFDWRSAPPAPAQS